MKKALGLGMTFVVAALCALGIARLALYNPAYELGMSMDYCIHFDKNPAVAVVDWLDVGSPTFYNEHLADLPETGIIAIVFSANDSRVDALAVAEGGKTYKGGEQFIPWENRIRYIVRISRIEAYRTSGGVILTAYFEKDWGGIAAPYIVVLTAIWGLMVYLFIRGLRKRPAKKESPEKKKTR